MLVVTAVLVVGVATASTVAFRRTGVGVVSLMTRMCRVGTMARDSRRRRLSSFGMGRHIVAAGAHFATGAGLTLTAVARRTRLARYTMVDVV